MAGAYDEYNKDIYCSDTYYTQEEFENIVVSAFKYVCEDVICKMDDFGRCVERFDPKYICPYFGIKKKPFINWIEENSDLRLIAKGDGFLDVGSLITPNINTYKLRSAVDYSKVPDCRKNCRYKEDSFMKTECTYPDLRYEAKLKDIGNNLDDEI